MSKTIERTDSYAYRQAGSHVARHRQKDRKRRLQIGRRAQTDRQTDKAPN